MFMAVDGLKSKTAHRQIPAYLLILRVKSIIETTDGKHYDALTRHILEAFSNGNSSSLTNHVRLHVKNYRTEIHVHFIVICL